MMAAMPGRAADVEVNASVTTGIDLDLQLGTTAHIASGVIVDNSSGTLINATYPALSATTQAWTVDIDGTVTTVGDPIAGDAIRFGAGGTITNNNFISGSANGIVLVGASSVTNTATGTISASNSAVRISGGTGTVTNSGQITGGSVGDAVLLSGGGVVTNNAGASILSRSTSNAVSLSGGASRRVDNYGSIRNTGAGFATGVLIQGGAGSITNAAGADIFGTYNGIYTSGSAPLTLTNDGSITSTNGPAVEAGGGGTFINTGTIETSGSSQGVKITGAATLTNSGRIASGSGAAVKFSGSADHTLTLDTGSELVGQVQAGTGTDNLILSGTGIESLARFESFDTLSMQGLAWTLKDTGAVTQSAEIQSGVLTIAGQLTSPTFDVLAAGTLAGSGTVVGTTTNAGTVVTGGTLTINGDFVNNAGTFRVGVTPSSNGVLTIVGAGHSATLGGGNVDVIAAGGIYAANTVYTILTAPTVTGAFSAVTINLAFLVPALSYDASNVYLTLIRNAVSPSSLGQTPNQVATGEGLDTLGIGDPLYDSLELLNEDEVRAALDRLSGEIHATALGMLIDDSRFFRDAMLDRLNGRLSGVVAQGDADPGRNVWVQGFGSILNADGDYNAAAARRRIGGVFFGYDGNWNDKVSAGVSGGYSHTALDVDGRGSSASIDSFHLGINGGTMLGGLRLSGGAGLSRHEIDTSRLAEYPGFSEQLDAGYSAWLMQAFAETGYRFEASPQLALEPFANIALVHLTSDGFSEQGGSAALGAADASMTTVFTTLGLRFDADLAGSGGMAKLHGSAAWRHGFGDDAPGRSLAFAAGGAFDITGVPQATDVALIAAGVSFAPTEGMTIDLSYNGLIGASQSDHGGSARLGFKF